MINFEYFLKTKNFGTIEKCHRKNSFNIFEMGFLDGSDLKKYIRNINYFFLKKNNGFYKEENNVMKILQEDSEIDEKSNFVFDFHKNFYTLKNIVRITNEYQNLNLFHRDLKPANYFLISDPTSFDGFKPILIDLALTTKMKYDNKSVGTPNFMAPEFRYDEISSKTRINGIRIKKKRIEKQKEEKKKKTKEKKKKKKKKIEREKK